MLLRSPAQGMHNSCKPHYWEAPWAICKQLHDQSGPHHPLLTYVTSGYGGGDLIKYKKAPEPISPMSLVGVPSLQWGPQLLGFNVVTTDDCIQPNSTTTVDLPTRSYYGYREWPSTTKKKKKRQLINSNSFYLSFRTLQEDIKQNFRILPFSTFLKI